MAGIAQTQGSFDTGRQITLVLIGPFGRVDLPNVTGFDAKQQMATVKVDRLDGVQMNASLPKGWTGSFELERGSAVIDALFDQIENAWFTSGSYKAGSIYQYVDEADESVSTFQFDNVALTLSESGNWKSDQSVKQRVDFVANRRRRV